MQDLVEAQTQDDEDLLVERINRASRHARDQVIARALPAQRAVNDGGCERAVPFVCQVAATVNERRGQVATVGGDKNPVGFDFSPTENVVAITDNSQMAFILDSQKSF